jgi:hypothetical protein
VLFLQDLAQKVNKGQAYIFQSHLRHLILHFRRNAENSAQSGFKNDTTRHNFAFILRRFLIEMSHANLT